MKYKLKKIVIPIILLVGLSIVLSSFLFINYKKHETNILYDIDGNKYNTIKIGNQEWMLENLKVTKYRNGDEIPNVKKKDEWRSLMTGAYSDYKNDPKISNNYGRLYNWFVIDDDRNIAPEGWHVPNNEDWATLINYLGGETKAGGKMKEDGTEFWDQPNSEATNSSGFRALPGGIRYVTGNYYSLGSGGYWWSSSKNESGFGSTFHIYYFFGNVYKFERHKELGVSIRCIKD